MDLLNEGEIKELIRLGKNIIQSLSCNANDIAFPCRTDRLQAIESMKKYLEIHGYVISRTV